MPTTVKEKRKPSENKKSELLLDSLEIRGYRCFEHLTIEKLGRVNLIVGKNNVGKTALLEALWIYAEGTTQRKVLDIIKQILEKRNEKVLEVKDENRLLHSVTLEIKEERGDYYRHLFFKRPKEKVINFIIDSKKPIDGSKPTKLFRGLTYSLNVEFGTFSESITLKNIRFHERINSFFVGAEGIDIEVLTQIWDDVILRNEEDEGLNALKIVSDKIIDLNFINYPRGSKNRVPVVRVEDISERVPLNSLGGGMNRLLGIALALVSCKDGVLIIDEIEVGLHYSVLPDVWKLIFKTAKDLNVQVFATTHSKDCIEAFAEAAFESPEDGMLIRLERQGEKIVAKTIEEEMLVDAVNYEVEVR